MVQNLWGVMWAEQFRHCRDQICLPMQMQACIMSEEFRRTVHAWRGTELPVQSAVSRAEVEELARDAEQALQATAEQSAWDVARLTQETGTTFGRVEVAMQDMDSRVESLDDRLLSLQTEQIQQQQRTQATLQSTAALEQQLHVTEQRLKQQADQNQATLQEQRTIHPQSGEADACRGEIASTG